MGFVPLDLIQLDILWDHPRTAKSFDRALVPTLERFELAFSLSGMLAQFRNLLVTPMGRNRSRGLFKLPRIRSIARRWRALNGSSSSLEDSYWSHSPPTQGAFQRVENRPIIDEVSIGHCCQGFELPEGGFVLRHRVRRAGNGVLGLLDVLSRWNVGPGRSAITAPCWTSRGSVLAPRGLARCRSRSPRTEPPAQVAIAWRRFVRPVHTQERRRASSLRSQRLDALPMRPGLHRERQFERTEVRDGGRSA